MRIAVDTNVLIRAHVPGLEKHESARAFITSSLAHPDTTLVLTPIVLHEFLHVVSDARRFDPAIKMSAALAVAATYLGRSNVECLPVTEEAMSFALELLALHRLGRKRIADTLFAATLLIHGVHRLATFNPADFALFTDLQVEEPRLSAE